MVMALSWEETKYVSELIPNRTIGQLDLPKGLSFALCFNYCITTRTRSANAKCLDRILFRSLY